MVEEVIDSEMGALGIPYQLMEYRDLGGGIPGCYYVGEDLQDPAAQEDGCRSGTFVLSGWSRSPDHLAELFRCKALIEARFARPVRVAGDSGAVVLELRNSAAVPSDADGVARIETSIDYHEWSVI